MIRPEDDFHAFESRHEFVLDNYRQYFIEQLKITPQMNNTLLYKRLKDDFGDEIEVPISTFHRYIKNLREQTGYVKTQRRPSLSSCRESRKGPRKNTTSSGRLSPNSWSENCSIPSSPKNRSS
jgi:hypothetical protein